MSDKQKITIATAKDFDVSYSVGSGNGGQAKQKCHSRVTIKHKESGAIAYSSESRSQSDNKKSAFIKLTKTPKFKFWLNKKLYELQNKETIEEAVERQMAPENLIIETLDENGKWIEYKEV